MNSIEFKQSTKSKTIRRGLRKLQEKTKKVNHSLELCPKSDTQLPNHCNYKWRAADYDSRQPQPFCLRNMRVRKVSKKIKKLSEVSTPAVSVASALLEVTEENATQLTLPFQASLFKVSQRVRQKKPDPLPRHGKPKHQFA